MKWWGHVPTVYSKLIPAVIGSGAGQTEWRAAPVSRYWRRTYQRLRERLGTPVLRARLGVGVAPFSACWFARGKPVHRYYVERFLADNAEDIREHCLEFQEDSYTTRFGGAAVTRLDILHKERDPRAPQATLYADLTRANDIPDAAFDCVICTYVLHVVADLPAFVGSLHRILRPGGVLLVAVPNITVMYAEFPELWRFTPLGLSKLLEGAFETGNVRARSYGNSLTCAGELRGLAVPDFSRAELDYDDPRFALVTCARAVKGKVD